MLQINKFPFLKFSFIKTTTGNNKIKKPVYLKTQLELVSKLYLNAASLCFIGAFQKTEDHDLPLRKGQLELDALTEIAKGPLQFLQTFFF